MATGLKNKQSFLIQKNWWLLKIFASKSPFWTLVFVAPLGAFFLSKINQPLTISTLILSALIGVLWWTFLEYMIHRFFFHWMSTIKKLVYYIGSFHLYHHQKPKDKRVYTSGVAPAVLWSVITMSVFPIFFTMNESLLISFFTLMSYFTYEFAHYYAHAWEAKSGYLKFIQQNHFHHHLNPKVNFGQTSPLWDYAFGTYEKANLKVNESKKEFLYIEEKWNS
tara:strand:+ start:2713 stop:3378 length:666 start_codon:yes stop_codon:yes gene_type:complete